MKQQDFDKQSRRIEDFAELNEVPIDHFLYQQLAQAARSFREGDIEKAQFQLDDALAAAQDFGTSPRDYSPQASISETITLTESQLRRIIRKTLREGVYEKLNSDVTGDSSNLDQEVYFGLEEDIVELIKKYADDLRYMQHGVTAEDVFEELKHVVSQLDLSTHPTLKM